MKTISSAVESYITTKPFLISALSQGIINLTSLSRNIKPEIEVSLKRKLGMVLLSWRLKDYQVS